MKKTLLLTLLALTIQNIKAQSLEWSRLFEVHSRNALAGFAKNTIKDSQNNLITAVIESDLLKLYRFDTQGNLIAQTNTHRTCGIFSPIVKISEAQYALVFNNSPQASEADFKLLFFNEDLEISQEVTLEFPNQDSAFLSSFFSLNGLPYFSLFTDSAHLIYCMNPDHQMVLKHTSPIANAQGERIKPLPDGNLIFDYREGMNHQLRCISPQSGQLLWQKSFATHQFNTFQLNYRTVLAENQTIHLAGLERTWAPSSTHCVVKFRTLDTQTGNLIRESSFALTDGGTEKIDDLKYNPANQHLYLSYLSNGAIQDEVVLEFDLNFNLVHQARLSYTYDTMSAWVDSKVIVRENGNLAFIYTNYKNPLEHGNLYLVNMNADLSINGSLEFNIAPKNSSEAFSHVLPVDNDHVLITGYVPNPDPMITYDEVQYYLAMVNLEGLLNSYNPEPLDHLLLQMDPVTDRLTIGGNQHITNLDFFDILGKRITPIAISQNCYDVSDLSHGLYLISATDDTGKVQRGKFIKD